MSKVEIVTYNTFCVEGVPIDLKRAKKIQKQLKKAIKYVEFWSEQLHEYRDVEEDRTFKYILNGKIIYGLRFSYYEEFGYTSSHINSWLNESFTEVFIENDYGNDIELDFICADKDLLIKVQYKLLKEILYPKLIRIDSELSFWHPETRSNIENFLGG